MLIIAANDVRNHCCHGRRLLLRLTHVVVAARGMVSQVKRSSTCDYGTFSYIHSAGLGGVVIYLPHSRMFLGLVRCLGKSKLEMKDSTYSVDVLEARSSDHHQFKNPPPNISSWLSCSDKAQQLYLEAITILDKIVWT
ncbi:hypothetical protein Tco_0550205 [Tanacetum coccineum]